MKFTIGYDPELSLVNSQGVPVSAIKVLKRSKADAIKLKSGAEFYYDNVLAEFRAPPSSCAEDAVQLFKRIFGDIGDYLDSEYDLFSQAAVYYDASQLDCEEARQIGCDPNFDSYLEAPNPKRQFADGLRTGSFHVHVGHAKIADNIVAAVNATKLFDIYLGCASVLLDKDPTAKDRRKYYGRAGEFRPTSYGFEYRVLGNYCLRTPTLTRLVFDIVEYAIGHVEHDTMLDVLAIRGIQLQAQRAINGNDPIDARSVLNKAGFPTKLLHRIEQHPVVENQLPLAAWA